MIHPIAIPPDDDFDVDVETVALNFVPYDWQRDLIDLMAKTPNARIVAAVPRRHGKTTLAAFLIFMAALARKGRYAIIMATKAAGVLVYRQIIHDLIRDIRGISESDGGAKWSLPNGSEVLFIGAEEGSGQNIRGLSLTAAIYDEVGTIDASAEAIYGALLPALRDNASDNSFLLCIGTPKEPSALGALFTAAEMPGSPWKSFHRTVYNAGLYDDATIEAIRAETVPSQFAQEWEVSLLASDDRALMSLGSIIAATKRTAPARVAHRPEYRGAYKVVSCDIASNQRTSDATIICRRWSDLVLPMIEVPKEQVEALPSILSRICREFEADQLIVDASGAGGAWPHLLARLTQLRLNPIPYVGSAPSPQPDVDFNLRAFCFRRLAEAIQQDRLILPSDDPQLVKELATCWYEHDSRQRLRIFPKDKWKLKLGGASPDRADALSMGYCINEDFRPQGGHHTGGTNGQYGQADQQANVYNPWSGGYS